MHSGPVCRLVPARTGWGSGGKLRPAEPHRGSAPAYHRTPRLPMPLRLRRSPRSEFLQKPWPAAQRPRVLAKEPLTRPAATDDWRR